MERLAEREVSFKPRAATEGRPYSTFRGLRYSSRCLQRVEQFTTVRSDKRFILIFQPATGGAAHQYPHRETVHTQPPTAASHHARQQRY